MIQIGCWGVGLLPCDSGAWHRGQWRLPIWKTDEWTGSPLKRHAE